MAPTLRVIAVFFALVAVGGPARAADQKLIDAAIDKGKSYLKERYKGGAGAGEAGHGIGPAALAGVAMLEARVPANDPAIKAVSDAVRAAAYKENRTYQIGCCIIFLDRLESPADVPLIQMLGMRMLAGQGKGGGWTYTCIEPVPQDTEQWLKANLKPGPELKTEPGKGQAKLHADVERYAQTLKRNDLPGSTMLPEDNSNTQFAILALWISRRHGIPADGALDMIEKRYLGTQSPAGSWAYSGVGVGGSASMTCAGLLGLATGIVRREERRLKGEIPGKEPKFPTKAEDPFFKPAAKPGETAPNAKPRIALTVPVQSALASLGGFLVSRVRGAENSLTDLMNKAEKDFYFLWSLERVGVIYGVDKIGGIDWYDLGSGLLLKSQNADGSWGNSGYGPEVNTSFALLFLLRADLLHDLSNKAKNAKDNELRAGTTGTAPSNGGTETAPMPKNPGTGLGTLPKPVEDESTKLANQLVLAPATDWAKALEKLRDAKGSENTKVLTIAIRKLDGERKKDAREALAERLTRMSAETLKGMMSAEDAELRRGAALAAAMKDDKAHIPDLIERIADEDDVVVRAARAGLKSLTSQDFGPKPGATREECKAAAAAWRAWFAKQK